MKVNALIKNPRTNKGVSMRHRLTPLDFMAMISLFLFKLLSIYIVESNAAMGMICTNIVGI
jgi:hypothetical protein